MNFTHLKWQNAMDLIVGLEILRQLLTQTELHHPHCRTGPESDICSDLTVRENH